MSALEIIQKIAIEAGVHRDELFSVSERKKVVAVRHAAIIAVHKAFPRRSIRSLANLFNRNHSTISYVFRKYGL